MAAGQKAITNRDLARGLGGTLLARMGAVVDVVAQPLYIYLFGLASYGLYAALWAAINIIENIADIGVTSALQRTVPQAADEREATYALRAALVVGLTPCVVLGVLFSVIAPYLTHVFNAPPEDEAHLVLAIRLFALALPLWAFVEIATSALRARRTFGAEIRLRTMWEQVARVAAAVVFFAISPSIISLIVAHLTSLTIVAALCVRLLGRTFELKHLFDVRPSDSLRPTLHTGLSILPSLIVARLFSDGPPLLLNVILPGSGGAAAAALYAIARKLASVVFLIRTASSYVLSPLASSAHRDHDALSGLYRYSGRLVLALALPLGCVMIGGSDTLIDLFGKQASGALAPLVILVLARIFEAIFGNAAAILLVIGDTRQRLLGSLVGLAVAAVLFAMLAPRYGVTGAAVAVACGVVISALVSFVQLWWIQGIHPFDGRFRHAFALASGIGAFAGLVAFAISIVPQVYETILLLALVPGTLWVSLRLVLSQEDRDNLGKVGRTLRLAGQPRAA